MYKLDKLLDALFCNFCNCNNIMLQVYVMIYSTFAVLQLGTNPQKHIWMTNTWLPVGI